MTEDAVFGRIREWFIAGASDNVTGVVVLEPGTFFPEDECPALTPCKSGNGWMKAQ